ncbi:MAG: hypothetical protein JW748_04135 [Anaerolineales bacterium]|nr:hypothetical protein [Anaerolineales bacterium]
MWFVREGDTTLVCGRPGARTVAHFAAHPKVAFHLNTDKEGGSVTVLVREAAADPNFPPAPKMPAHLKKCRKGIRELKMTPEDFVKNYSAEIRINPLGLRGW